MAEKELKRFRLEKWLLIGVLLLLPNSGYLLAFSEASIFYLCNVFLHAGLGLLLFLPILLCGRRFIKHEARTGNELGLFAGHLGYWLFAAGMALGLYLMIAGVRERLTLFLYAHVALCFVGLIFLLISIRRVGHQISIDNPINTAGRYLLVFLSIAVCIPILVITYRFVFVRHDDRIHNPHAAPKSMAAEAMGGEQGPFYPSSVATTTQDTIATDFMLTPETCGAAGCHPDIYRQWQSSAHRYSDYSNLWYRKAITTAELRLGNTATKWCAGCHTPAVLLNGDMRLPSAEHSQSPAAHAGISCTLCHGIVDVRGTMGQGGFISERPKLFDMLASKNPTIKNLYAWFVHLDPKPHRDTFRQPFHRNENGAFCSSCHKAHTDVPLNQARWLQIMNDYDSWQSGNFGQGDRDFAYIEKRKNCVACHMPFVNTQDGKSYFRDHRFLGANTLLPSINADSTHLQATIDYLRDHRLTLDLFALSLAPVREAPAPPVSAVREDSAQVATVLMSSDINTTQAVFAMDSAVVPLAGPTPRLKRGQSFRLDVVVRSRDIGHNFPAGAADMAQAWLELKMVDENGKVIFWSGATRGTEVDPQAHFYGVEMVDSTGRRTVHERSWEARVASFSNLLPPNSAEVVRYRAQIPEDCGELVTVEARLHYRKYHPSHLEWLQDPDLQPMLGNARKRSALGDMQVPAVEMAYAKASLLIGASDNHTGANDTANAAMTAERWQNYGIGLLRQNELAAAEHAFTQALRLAPDDDYLAINLGLIQLRTGRVREARAAFEAAVQKADESGRAHYYLGMALKAEGDYRKALNHVKRASELARRDREFRIEIGRLYHLLGDYERAIRSFKRALRIDPEAPAVYHEMMKTYLAKGDSKSAARVEQLYRRFTKDEQMRAMEKEFRPQILDAPPQTYHEHDSIDPSWLKPKEESTNGYSSSLER